MRGVVLGHDSIDTVPDGCDTACCTDKASPSGQHLPKHDPVLRLRVVVGGFVRHDRQQHCCADRARRCRSRRLSFECFQLRRGLERIDAISVQAQFTGIRTRQRGVHPDLAAVRRPQQGACKAEALSFTGPAQSMGRAASKRLLDQEISELTQRVRFQPVDQQACTYNCEQVWRLRPRLCIFHEAPHLGSDSVNQEGSTGSIGETGQHCLHSAGLVQQ
mmetsp:Transcript_90205/g.291614  ORF Transcript_90205/g.291614 Transcript_90205/m.291614 type:complete len:218 (-) Transcript_90205:2223-2876(-)